MTTSPGSDALYHDPRLADFYDIDNGWADDTRMCLDLAREAGSVLDFGCGTGLLAAACADRGADALRWLRRKPLLAAAIAAAWAVLKRGSALTRLGRFWDAWSAARRVLRWAQRG